MYIDPESTFGDLDFICYITHIVQAYTHWIL